MNTLELDGVSKHFAGIKAVDGVTFAVEDRSITALIGPNGAGKTTLINLVTGIFAPTTSDIRFLGRDLKESSPAEVGYAGIRRTFHTVHLAPGLTVTENFALGRYRNSVRENPWRALLPGRLGDARGRKEIADILDRLRLSDKADVIATELPTERSVRLKLPVYWLVRSSCSSLMNPPLV